MHQMNPEHLALFHAVVETGSITAGAAQLHLSQPAGSKRLADLERAVGLTLFDRLPKRGVRLTAAGEVLATYSGRLVALRAQAERSLRGMVNIESGRLAIGASSTIGTYLLPAPLAAFRSDHPGIEIELRIGNSDAIVALLRDARIDIAFTEDNRAAPGDGITSEILSVDELVVVCRPGHALLQRPPLSPTELVRYPFILRESGSGTRCVLESSFAAHGLSVIPDLVLGSNEAIKQAIPGCNHLTALPRMSIVNELVFGRLAELPSPGLQMRRELLLLRQDWRSDAPAARTFLAGLCGAVGRR